MRQSAPGHEVVLPAEHGNSARLHRLMVFCAYSHFKLNDNVFVAVCSGKPFLVTTTTWIGTVDGWIEM